MKSAESWVAEWRNDCDLNHWRYDEPLLETLIKNIQVHALNDALKIADTFAINHKLSAPEVIVAIQIRDAIERIVKEIEK